MDPKYRNQCRGCLEVSPSTVLYDLSDPETRNLFTECTTLQMDPADEYPQQICAQCWKQCTRWHEFKSQVLECDQRLKDGFDDPPWFSEDDGDSNAQDEYFQDITGSSLENDEVVEVDETTEEEEEEIAPPPRVNKRSRSCSSEAADETQDLPYLSCTKCVKTFHSESALTLHGRYAHPQTAEEQLQKLKCRFCSSIFGTAKTLNSHERTHTHPFKCGFCLLRFEHNVELERHKTKHEASFKCNHCGEEFKLHSRLLTHRKKHDLAKPKPFSCDYCLFSCDSDPILTHHALNSHLIIRDIENGDRKAATNPIKCVHCKEAFDEPEELKDHVFLDHNHLMKVNDPRKFS